jgi:crotonobetainyl-CoA:carnitine CoA-transferase CaiB-like acyl-CoA transferase
MLSELGAEIVKVEIPGKGEPERLAMPMTPQRESYQFLSYNRGKKSITLNLKSPKGLESARKLAAKADVLVESFATGGMERLGWATGPAATTFTMTWSPRRWAG